VREAHFLVVSECEKPTGISRYRTKAGVPQAHEKPTRAHRRMASRRCVPTNAEKTRYKPSVAKSPLMNLVVL